MFGSVAALGAGFRCVRARFLRDAITTHDTASRTRD
jgi:hypothetical protein